NATVTRAGALVMGRGAALAAKKKFEGLEYDFGQQIFNHKTPLAYGLLISVNYPKVKIGAFQTKVFWSDRSFARIIDNSCKHLRKWMKANPTRRIHVTFPGIGEGKISEEEVLEVMDKHRFSDNLVLRKLKQSWLF